jgi:hypothetical protein
MRLNKAILIALRLLVCRTMLHIRLYGNDFYLKNKKLTDLEELILIQWILSMENRDLPLRLDSIQQMAVLLL